MRTKILLGVVAAMAVGIASSMAQTTYSQNFVGYINITVPASNYAPIGNTLVNGSDANQTNGDLNTCFNAGFISDPDLADANPVHGSNSVCYVWNGVTFVAWYYFNATDANTWNGTPTSGWYDLNGDYANIKITSGNAVFVQNSVHSPAAMTVTLTGNVLQGANTLLTIASGNNFMALAQPIYTNPVAQPFGLPLNLTSTGSPPGGEPTQTSSDTIYVWNGVTYVSWYYFNATDANTWNGTPTAGFYDGNGDLMGTPGYNAPAVSQGFFLWHNGAPIVWSNSFTVQ